MTFKTLKTIEKSLEKAIADYERDFTEAKNIVNHLYDLEEQENPTFSEKELEEWKIRKRERLDNLTEARTALEDFYNHDWR